MVKFGRRLVSERKEEWAEHYIDYKVVTRVFWNSKRRCRARSDFFDFRATKRLFSPRPFLMKLVYYCRALRNWSTSRKMTHRRFRRTPFSWHQRFTRHGQRHSPVMFFFHLCGKRRLLCSKHLPENSQCLESSLLQVYASLQMCSVV